MNPVKVLSVNLLWIKSLSPRSNQLRCDDSPGRGRNISQNIAINQDACHETLLSAKLAANDAAHGRLLCQPNTKMTNVVLQDRHK